MLPASSDVVIVGGGNAALCAALAAAEHGISVLVLERAPEDESGGNSRFTAGAMRCVYDGVDDLKALMPDLTEQEIAQTDFGTYPEEQFFDDMYRVTEYRTDPELRDRWDQYLFGPDLMVAPLWRVGDRARDVYFPRGRWRSYWDDSVVYDGPLHAVVEAPLDVIPVFVRDGAYVPRPAS